MKKINFLLLIFCVSFGLISCSSDDDGASTSDRMIVDGTSYELESAIISNYGSFDGVSNFDLALVSSDVIKAGNVYLPEQEKVSALYFELYTEVADQLPLGTYTFDDNETAGTFSANSMLLITNNWANEDDAEYIGSLASGTIEVLKNGPTEYEFTFDVTTTDGKKVTGYFKDNDVYLEDDSWDRPSAEKQKGFFN
ncbi:hypothetical protein [uncultured Mesonia sp.]|uniref:hypothetical protein n=1 Tax=uncultured Mesonia sp. TaxID=399731 RepID=UPI00374FA140